ncbi:T9SS type A sorting domain-containing protein [Flavivirga abyssicola]|uniref:T9SS type A sorting domain-containing protein n=1 Tax=Flavivirga abyssicola TaxID=3063533 RepID=UPI0026DF2408|nr:T9SS type A sorting domain-containing protein [Flavivirga sp. MEBiC07777]WVK12560.1 T9SS type A sorting domain-containing protein [Flavivirga sp. MEBiC07777]
MKTYKIFIFLFFFYGLTAEAQKACEESLEKAKQLLTKASPFTEQSDIFKLIEPCASNGNAEAENYLGMLYLKGIGVPIDNEKAFLHISNAAGKGYANAQYNLGRLYKYGTGCSINFIQAMEWFTKATENGSQRAAYSMGYMYYKGIGVSQNYQKAVYWFERSEDPMAKHFLGLCYYLGYGVAANKDKALGLLLNNPTLNSKTLVSYIKREQKEMLEAKVIEDLEVTAPESKPINPEVVIETQEELEYLPYDKLELEEIKGAWSGKLLQYDWSGKYIQRIIPITITIDIDKESNEIQVSCILEEQKINTHAIWQDETLYFKNLSQTVRLSKLYPQHPTKLTLDYNLLATSLQKYTYQNSKYLIGYLDTYIPEWTEYGAPMSLVLKPEGSKNGLNEEALLALAAQGDQFIKLYPVPFNEQLTIQYQLKVPSSVYVELISLNSTNKIVVLPSIRQQAGDYTYTIPVESSLPKGLYVVRLIAGEQLYTRMIIKDN